VNHETAIGRYVLAREAAEGAATDRRRALGELGRLTRGVIDNEMPSGEVTDVDLDALGRLLEAARAADKAMREAMARANEVAADAARPVLRLQPGRQ
jgi:hypothetical protein